MPILRNQQAHPPKGGAATSLIGDQGSDIPKIRVLGKKRDVLVGLLSQFGFNHREPMKLPKVSQFKGGDFADSRNRGRCDDVVVIVDHLAYRLQLRPQARVNSGYLPGVRNNKQ